MTPDYCFAGMSDGQVIELAALHFKRAAEFPPGSQRRAIEWAKFVDAYDEYGRREDQRAQRMVARHLSRLPAG